MAPGRKSPISNKQVRLSHKIKIFRILWFSLNFCRLFQNSRFLLFSQKNSIKTPALGSKGGFRDFGMGPNRAYLGTFWSGPRPKLKVEGWPEGPKIDFASALPKRTKRPDLAGESGRTLFNANGREFAANGHLRFSAQNPGSGPTKIGRSKWGVPVEPENGVCGSV